MKLILRPAALLAAVVISVVGALAQSSPSAVGAQLAQLNSLKEKIKNPDTRTRVDAFHQVWIIAISTDNSDVKVAALDLLKEPVASASDHIRMPAVYAIAEVANSTSDAGVKAKALAAMKEPLMAAQLPIRLVALDAINSVMRIAKSPALSLQAIELIGELVRSGNNGVRIPAINAVGDIAIATADDRVSMAAIELLQAPLDSMAMIGGMEVRLMAVVEIERLGMQATDGATKAKAMGMLQACASNGTWEPEARHRAAEGAARIQSTLQAPPEQKQKSAPPASTLPG